MPQVNCFLPVRIRIAGSARNLDFEALGNVVADTVEKRLRDARGSIALQSGECWAPQVHAPAITFNADSVPGDVRAGIERTVHDAIERVARRLGALVADAGSSYRHDRPDDQPDTVQPMRASDDATTPETASKSPAQKQSAWWDSLRTTVLSRDTSRPEEQRRAVELLVELLDMEDAREILRLGLNIPALESIVRLEILERLLVLFDRGDTVWDLILSGVGSRHGSRHDELAEYKFFQWLQLSEGSETVAFLDRKLSGKDEEMQRKAAMVMAYLLPKELDPGAEGLRDKFSDLKEVAVEHEVWGGGALGAESLRQIVHSEITALIDLCAELIGELETSPHEDRFANADAVSLERFQQTLRAQLTAAPALDPHRIEELVVRLEQALEAAVFIASRARTIRENAAALIRFIGLNAGESGEIAALFELRHEYISVLTSALVSTRLTSSLSAIDARYRDFANTVTGVRRRRVLERFGVMSGVFLQAKQLSTTDQSYRSMVEQLERMERVVLQRLQADSLSDVVLSETAVGVWGLQIAMFALYAAALGITTDRKAAQAERLRVELAGYFQKTDLKSFSDRAESIENALQQLEARNRNERRPDSAIHSLIVAVAAARTLGASQLVRLALCGAALAILGTADAAGDIGLLVETGVFADDELDGSHLEFDQAIGLGAAAQSFLSDHARLEVVRALGRFSDNRPLITWIAPRLVNVTALEDVSTLMNRLDTNVWPAGIASFLLRGLSNCAVVAALDSQSSARTLEEPNRALLDRYRRVIESKVLTEPEFAIIGNLGRALTQRGREVAVLLRNERQLSDEQFQGIEEYLQSSDTFATSSRFVTPEPQLVGTSGERLVRPLPAPGDIHGLTRVGESNVYCFNPLDPPDLASMLSRYAVAGYGMQRYPSGLVRVVAGDGRTAFLLDPRRHSTG